MHETGQAEIGRIMKTVGYVLSDFPVLSQSFVGTEMRAMAGLGHGVEPLVLRRGDGAGQPEDGPLAARSRHLDEVALADLLPAALVALRNLRRWLPFLLAQRVQPRRSLIWSALRLAALARASGCRHLHAHFAQASTAAAILAGRMAGCGVSFVGHGHDVYAAPEDLPAKLRAADFAVAVCADMEADFRAMAADAEVKLIPCGIEAQRFRPAEPTARQHSLHILFVGRLVDSKGLDDLLHAMALGRRSWSFSLTVVGDGPLRGELQALAADLGLGDAVTFAGARPTAWFAERAGEFDVLAAPFRPGRNGTRDTGPIVLKEAMALGLPVVGTRFMGIKEIVDGRSGRLVPVGDRAALAGALLELAALPAHERARMGAAGRARVLAHFTSAGQAKVLSASIEGLR
jgi:glycosyltransferase involved in cell wall biosynthesis